MREGEGVVEAVIALRPVTEFALRRPKVCEVSPLSILVENNLTRRFNFTTKRSRLVYPLPCSFVCTNLMPPRMSTFFLLDIDLSRAGGGNRRRSGGRPAIRAQ